MSKKVPVRVLLRVRPAKATEEAVIEIGDAGDVQIPNPQKDTQKLQFRFSRCCTSDVSQTQLFADEIMPFVSTAFDGGNASVFAYGPTGAGKTYTMQGYEGEHGIIPRAVGALLEASAKESSDGKFADHSISISYLEIYNEKVKDLLEPKETDLAVRANAAGEILVPGLACVSITSSSQFDDLFEEALKHRSVGATKLNSRSSRSHSVLMVKIKKRNIDTGGLFVGKLHLIDLAGSEDNRKTDNSGIRMKESGAINTSLFVLAKVVDALNAKHNRIPYRDSKLTRLLQDSLGGGSKACIIVNVAPTGTNETCCALSFGSKSRNIVNAPIESRPVTAPPPSTKRALGAKVDFKVAPREVMAPLKKRNAKSAPPNGAKRARKVTGDGWNSSSSRSGTSTSNSTTGTTSTSTSTTGGSSKASSRGGETEAEMEARLLKKVEGQVAAKYAKMRKKAGPIRMVAAHEPKTPSKKPPAATVKALPTMTPGSKMEIAKAILMQAKAYAKYDKHEALRCYEQARSMLPSKPRLDEIIAELRAELKPTKARKEMPAKASEKPKWSTTGKSKDASSRNVTSRAGRKPLQSLDRRHGVSHGNVAKSSKALGTDKTTAGKSKSGKRKVADVDDAAPPRRESTISPDDPDWQPSDSEGDDTMELPRATKRSRAGASSTEPPAAELEPAAVSSQAKELLEGQLLEQLNQHGLKELMALKGIGKKRAENIIRFRDEERVFNKVTDLRLCGFGEKMVTSFLENNLGSMPISFDATC